MKPSPELMEIAVQELDRLCRLYPLGYRPSLEWRSFRTTAGMAYYRRRAIGLGAAVADTREKVVSTLIHEYAHLLAYARYGQAGAGHGVAWQAAMRELGVEPKVRHTYEVARNKPRQQVVYRCLRCGSEISRSRRLPRGRKYVHASCGGGLRLERVVPATSATTRQFDA